METICNVGRLLFKALRHTHFERAENQKIHEAINNLTVTELRDCQFALTDLSLELDFEPMVTRDSIGIVMRSENGPLDTAKFNSGTKAILHQKVTGMQWQVTVIPKSDTDIIVNVYRAKHLHKILDNRDLGIFYITVAGKMDLDDALISKLELSLSCLALSYRPVSASVMSALFSSYPHHTLADGMLALYEGHEEAVRIASARWPVCNVLGPPGTGKTYLCGRIINQAVSRGDRVLVVAPSNASCDAITMAIERHWTWSNEPLIGNLVRYADPDKLTDVSVKKYLPQEIYHVSPSFYKHAPPGELDYAFKYHRHSTKIKFKKQIDSARVVVCTNSRAMFRVDPELFDMILVDEAGFVRNAELIPLLMRARRVVMCGDYKQLKPTAISKEASEDGQSTSYFEVICKTNPHLSTMLTEQFRSNSLICGWSSEQFYESRVSSCGSVRGNVLANFSHIVMDHDTLCSLQFLDTAGKGYHETMPHRRNIHTAVGRDATEHSIFNKHEALIVMDELTRLLSKGVKTDQIAVLSPYKGQLYHLKTLMKSKGLQSIDCNSVDGFQGRDTEVVIVTFVRSNKTGNVGFLANPNRLNVLTTRAKRRLVLIGDSDTLRSDETIDSLFSYCRIRGAVSRLHDKYVSCEFSYC